MSHDLLQRHSINPTWCPSSPGRISPFVPFPAGSVPCFAGWWICSRRAQDYGTIPLWAAGTQDSCVAALAERSGTSGSSPDLVGMEGSDAISSKVESLLQESRQYSALGDSCFRGREMKGMRAAQSFSIFSITRSRQFFGSGLLSFLPGHRLPGYV